MEAAQLHRHPHVLLIEYVLKHASLASTPTDIPTTTDNDKSAQLLCNLGLPS